MPSRVKTANKLKVPSSCLLVLPALAAASWTDTIKMLGAASRGWEAKCLQLHAR